MKVCSVELRSNEAIICLLTLEGGMIGIPECRTQKFVMDNSLDNQKMRDFQFAFKKLLDDYKVEKVVIRTRETRGKFAGSSVGFKLESAIQLIDDLDVSFMSNADIKEKLKRNPMAIDFRATGLRQFQEAAFTTGYAFLGR